jgi:hypothetical protein
MSERLQDIVQFRGDRLFNGAVNIGWFDSDAERTRAAAEAFVFHGPAYHGVSQDDVGVSHGHQLQDTANFARSVIKRCYGLEDQPFTLAIAGYGTGKSHLGLTLSTLLSKPGGDVADAVLEGVDRADDAIGVEIRTILNEADQPCLVVALNGMQSFDLTTEVTRQILQQINSAGLDTRPLDDLRPRFAQAANLIRMAATNNEVVNALLDACETDALEDILTGLDQQDETVYGKVHGILAARNIQITALGGESVRDVIDVACREYCGPEKAFRCMAVIFDEFGRYTEFATVRSHIAGSGVLQDLFEGIQANTGNACFAGFIQFDLNAYVQRVAPEHRNEILRYVTRYQSANRVYLSINLETLIASLIEKKLPDELAHRFDSDGAKQESEEIVANIGRRFPQSRNHRLWSDSAQFHSVVRRGCWPLSAYSTWFLFHLAAAGKHLQERSALALLGDVFERFSGRQLGGDTDWLLAPVDFWSDSLQHELITSEESGQQGSITHAYASVFARHEAKIDGDLIRLLRAVVLASKMGLKAQDKDDAIEALSELAGLHLAAADKGVQQLKDEYNVLEWDESFKEFDILGDAVPRTQFLSFVRNRVASAYDEAGKAALFASKAATWCDLLGDLDCDFAEENRITTREWRYAGVTSSLDVLNMQVKLAADRWSQAMAVDEPRGTIIYCYVEASRDADVVAADVGKLLRAVAKQAGENVLPILVVLLCDTESTLGQSIAELAVIDESLSEEDRSRFRNLIPSHQEKMCSVMRSQIESMIKQRRYVTACKEPLDSRRLTRAGSELFSRIYESILTFPFDGFSTARGNAADSCQELTTELLIGKLDYDGVLSKPIKIKNRALTVLKNSWDIFAQDGNVRTMPTQKTVKQIIDGWDNVLENGDRKLPLRESILQLCRPPFGANIASAGLLFGVFVAARFEKVCIVLEEKQYSISQFVQQGIFRRKFLDISTLHNCFLIYIGGKSSEWESLCDEWEQAESYIERKSYFERARNLEINFPVPPNFHYRKKHLEEQAKKAIEELDKMDRKKSVNFSRINSGKEREDINLLSWGASNIVEIIHEMNSEKHLWLDQQKQELQPFIESSCQAIVQSFPTWLKNQYPKVETAEAVGEFKHKMSKVISKNLKILGLDDLCYELDRHTHNIVKNFNTYIEAVQLIKEIDPWIITHTDPNRIKRVAEIRDAQQIGKKYQEKLVEISSRISKPEIWRKRNELNETIKKLKKSEKNIINEALELWNFPINNKEDIDFLVAKTKSFISIFEGCQNDLDDLEVMIKALRFFQEYCKKIHNDNLSWIEFEKVISKHQKVAFQLFDEEELPWQPDQVLINLARESSDHRINESRNWVESIENEAFLLHKMEASDANRLLTKIENIPPFITNEHSKELAAIARKVVIRLDSLKLAWVIEKYNELKPEQKEEFLSIINN